MCKFYTTYYTSSYDMPSNASKSRLWPVAYERNDNRSILVTIEHYNWIIRMVFSSSSCKRGNSITSSTRPEFNFNITTNKTCSEGICHVLLWNMDFTLFCYNLDWKINYIKGWQLDAFWHRSYCTVTLNSNFAIWKTWNCI